jgi:hypothetical protein
VFQVSVFHAFSMARIRGIWGNRVSVPRMSQGQFRRIPLKNGIAPPFGTVTNQLKSF